MVIGYLKIYQLCIKNALDWADFLGNISRENLFINQQFEIIDEQVNLMGNLFFNFYKSFLPFKN